MGISPEPDSYPLCSIFLSGYLSKRKDLANFPPNEPEQFQRYERLFASALKALHLRPDGLRRRPEFNFDSGDAKNLESAIAVLRTVVFLQEKQFLDIALIKSKSSKAADIICERNGQKICCEVKTVTKQSSGRRDCFLEDQVYEKIRESISTARKQLQASTGKLHCEMSIAVFVVNWFTHSLTLDQKAFQNIVDRLEQGPGLDGVSGVLFITAAGQCYSFLSDEGKTIDW